MNNIKTSKILFPITIFFTLAAALTGILSDKIYSRELPYVTVKTVADDYILLLCIVPLAVFSFIYLLQNKTWAKILVLGISSHLLFFVGFNLFSLRLNGMFFVYAAVTGLSFFTIVSVFPVVTESIREPAIFRGRRVISITLFFIAVSGLQFWVGDVLPAIINSAVPESIRHFDVPVNVATVIDLGFMIPLMVVGSVLLWKGRARGTVISMSLFIWLILTCISVISMEIGLLRAGLVYDMIKISAFSVEAALSIVMLLLMIRGRVTSGQLSAKSASGN